MAKTKTAKRYAKALFDLALETGRLDRIWGDLTSLSQIIQDSVELVHFLEDPLLSAHRKRSILIELFEDKLDRLTFQFIVFLVDKKRITLLQPCCTAFDDLYYKYKGILRVSIISAKPLSDKHTASIDNKLKEKFQKEIESCVIVDPKLLGGFRIIVGDQVLDFSLQTQLQRIKQNIIRA